MKIENFCSQCRQETAIAKCGVCSCPLCKECEQFLQIDSFAFRENVPDFLTQGHYCPSCYDEKISPELTSYEEVLERARTVYIFFDSQPKPRTLIKRSNKKISVFDCKDRDETFLRLGFRAAEQGFNAVIEVEVERTRVGHRWEGSGTPANVDAKRQENFRY